MLYELLTGKMVFHCDTVPETMAAVLKNDPDWSQLPVTTPIRVRVLLRRCLQKDPKQRLRDIGDARIWLDEVFAGEPESSLTEQTGILLPPRRRALPWVLFAATAAVLAALAFVHFREGPSETGESVRFQIPLPDKAAMTTVGAFTRYHPTGADWLFAARRR